MSKYTTGEIAKLCGVTVRTVQYYDARDILTPSELSDGGRRLYSEEDLGRMKIVCFLREIGLPINSIARILKEENCREVISLLLAEQEKLLKAEIGEKQDQLAKIALLAKEVRNSSDFTVESIGDVALKMNNRKKLRKIRTVMLTAGIAMELVEIALLVLWIKKGVWLPYVIWLVPAIIGGVLISKYYFSNVNYICPECHTVFKPRFKEAFWANHTPNTRKLICPHCGKKSFCVETAAEALKSAEV